MTRGIKFRSKAFAEFLGKDRAVEVLSSCPDPQFWLHKDACPRPLYELLKVKGKEVIFAVVRVVNHVDGHIDAAPGARQVDAGHRVPQPISQ